MIITILIITILIIIMIIIKYSPHLFYKAFLFATKNLHPQYQFSTNRNIHFQSHFCQEQSNIKRFTLPHLSSWCQPFPVTTNQEHHYQNQCPTIVNWGFSLFMNSFNSEIYVGFFAQYAMVSGSGWQDLAGFRQGQKWPWNLSSSAYLQFSQQMRRFCA